MRLAATAITAAALGGALALATLWAALTKKPKP